MKALRLLIPVATLVAALVATSGLGFATKKMMEEAKAKNCQTCHTKGKELNDVGKHYKEKKTLDGAPLPK
jgi:predicted nucleic acid-binding protein